MMAKNTANDLIVIVIFLMDFDINSSQKFKKNIHQFNVFSVQMMMFISGDRNALRLNFMSLF